MEDAVEYELTKEAIEKLIQDVEHQSTLDMNEAASRGLPISGIAISTLIQVDSLRKKLKVT